MAYYAGTILSIQIDVSMTEHNGSV